MQVRISLASLTKNRLVKNYQLVPAVVYISMVWLSHSRLRWFHSAIPGRAQRTALASPTAWKSASLKQNCLSLTSISSKLGYTIINLINIHYTIHDYWGIGHVMTSTWKYQYWPKPRSILVLSGRHHIVSNDSIVTNYFLYNFSKQKAKQQQNPWQWTMFLSVLTFLFYFRTFFIKSTIWFHQVTEEIN